MSVYEQLERLDALEYEEFWLHAQHVIRQEQDVYGCGRILRQTKG